MPYTFLPLSCDDERGGSSPIIVPADREARAFARSIVACQPLSLVFPRTYEGRNIATYVSIRNISFRGEDLFAHSPEHGGSVNATAFDSSSCRFTFPKLNAGEYLCFNFKNLTDFDVYLEGAALQVEIEK